MDFSNMEDAVYGGDLENDLELLAELEALQGGGAPSTRRAPAPTASAPARRTAPAAPPPPARSAAPVQQDLSSADLERALRGDIDLGEGEADLDDPDLEGELLAMLGEDAPSSSSSASARQPPALPPRDAPPPLPTHASAPPPVPARKASSGSGAVEGQAGYLRRLGDHYEKMRAAETNELKANRYKRSADKCRELERKAAAGRPVDPADFPPAPPNFAASPPPDGPVAKAAPAAPVPPRPVQTAPQVHASLPAPVASVATEEHTQGGEGGGSGKMEEMKRILQRRRDMFVANAKAAVAAKDKEAAKEFVEASKQFDEAIAALATVDVDQLDPEEIPPSPLPYRKKITVDNTPAKTFEEGLQKRKARFDAMAAEWKEKGDDRKYRMNMRQSAAYAEAIKAAARGQPVEVSELPSLPDMPPLPKQTATAAARPKQVGGASAAPGAAASARPPASLAQSPGAAERSTVNDQLAFVMERQRQFKVAAVAAKSAGNMELAKKYLVEAKGFDRMIAACKAGLNVDITKTPIPPQVTTSKSALQPKVDGGEASTGDLGDRDSVLATLEKDLIGQVQLAENNRLRFTRLGDVAKVRQFEDWAKAAKQDLLLVREVARRGLKTPRFHREQRHIPSADFFPDLAEDVLEVSILNAVDVPLPPGYEPEHANLFVKYTFPYPTDAPQTGKTKYAAGSRSPAWNETVVVQIGSKKARGNKLLRVLKRLPLKLEVYQKGGFLRSDKLIGVGECKLDGLETKAEVEEGCAIKDGRKAMGGVISARVRIREPLADVKGHSRVVNWLVIDV